MGEGRGEKGMWEKVEGRRKVINAFGSQYKVAKIWPVNSQQLQCTFRLRVIVHKITMIRTTS